MGIVRRARATVAARTRPASSPATDFSGFAVVERVFVRAPIRLLRACNTVLDLLFYDVGALPAAERRRLTEWSDPDGSIVVVEPAKGGVRRIDHLSVEAFLRAPDLGRFDTVAVAGVGSSAVGTAALAANVADALGRPVVGIVSGYGVADALSEGLAGWFVLRPRNQLRQFVDAFLAPWTPLLARVSEDTQPNGDPFRLLSYVRGAPESDALRELLRLSQSKVSVAVGHSKGNLTLAAVLHELRREPSVPLGRFEVVTLGAPVALPRTLKLERQFLGALDSFGGLNAIAPQLAAAVPWATHTLNRRMAFPLCATSAVAVSGVGGTTPAAWPAESLAQKFADAALAPARFASDWLEIAAGAFAAVGSAVKESMRSLQDGARQVARGPRRPRAA